MLKSEREQIFEEFSVLAEQTLMAQMAEVLAEEVKPREIMWDFANRIYDKYGLGGFNIFTKLFLDYYEEKINKKEES